jgi:hypothetical protein
LCLHAYTLPLGYPPPGGTPMSCHVMSCHVMSCHVSAYACTHMHKVYIKGIPIPHRNEFRKHHRFRRARNRPGARPGPKRRSGHAPHHSEGLREGGESMKIQTKSDRYRRAIESMACERGELRYTEVARALNVTPSYARALLETHCPGTYESGTCTADPDACPKKEEKKEGVEA